MSRKEYQPIYFRIDSMAWLTNGELVPVGEPLTAEMIMGKTGKAPKGGFDIVRVPFLNTALERVCREQGKVLAYLFANRNFENIVDKTNAQISQATGVSRSTIVRMIDALEDEGLLVQTRGKIYINPRMIHRGDNVRESVMYTEFENIMKFCKKGEYKETSTDSDSDL